ncbi:MAG: DUF418 domain-containing protein [Bacteroidota bacterium]|nr:DUF418 domain-containing protein [Bacteroidota bacterium]
MSEPATFAQTLPLEPVRPQERIETIDILRGFAIFGILIVNMQFYSAPFYLYLVDTPLFTNMPDRIAGWFIRFFAEGKFYSIFSLLFGFGLIVQMARAEVKAVSFLPIYRRRLFVLLLFGLVHGFLFWSGDILFIYAILGFVLLLFRNRKPKTIITWAIISILLPVLFAGLGSVFIEIGRSIPQAAAQIDASFAEAAKKYNNLVAESIVVYSQGSYSEILSRIAQDTLFMYTIMIFWAPNILSLFLVGLYIARRGILNDIPAHLPFIKQAQFWGLGLGIVGNFLFVLMREYSNPSVPSFFSFLFTLGFAIGAPSFCFFYAASIIRMTQNYKWKKKLLPFASIGRMAISNYLFQTLICITIFYSYGFGLYGKFGPLLGILLTVGIFIIQIALSTWWLKRFQFGPVKWLWRSLTYRKAQPMRLRA